MNRNKAIVAFLILLFSFQFMPIKQVGSFLYCNQLTEELPHAGDNGSNTANFTDGASKYIDHADALHHLVMPNQDISLKLDFVDEEFISRNADDISTPPPNFPSS
jgi:hypothetical protein